MPFDKKLIREEPLTDVAREVFHLWFRNSARRWGYYFALLLVLITAAGFLQNRIWSLAHRSALEATFLAREAKSEVGPGFKLAAAAHLQLISLYRERLESRPTLRFAWFTLPLHAPDRNLKSAIDALTNVVNNGGEAEAKRVIKHDAANALGDYAGRLERMSAIRYKGFPVGICPVQDEQTLRQFLNEFNIAFTNMLASPTPDNAEKACFQSRTTTGAFLMIGPEFVGKNGSDELDTFVEKLKTLSTEMAKLATAAQVAQRAEEHERLDHYSKNVLRRAMTLPDHIR